jgi:hypothetical protein
MSFADLKKQSSLGSLTQKLVKEVEKMSTTSNGADERLWKPEMDKTGNGFAVIRFLPAPEGEELPWAKIYSHAFQGPGGWYIENITVNCGTVVVIKIKKLCVNRSANCLTTATSML